MPPPPTIAQPAEQMIIDLKKAFLTTQIRLLTAPVQPPPADWQEQLPEPEEGDLRESVVRDVLHKGAVAIFLLCLDRELCLALAWSLVCS